MRTPISCVSRRKAPVHFATNPNPFSKSGDIMQLSKKMLFAGAVVPLIAGLGGCANKLIEKREGSERIAVLEASQVGSCRSKGLTTVSVLAEVGFITRSPEAVEANLLQLASNSAVDSGGDTLVKGNSTEFGKRTFEIFKCKP